MTPPTTATARATNPTAKPTAPPVLRPPPPLFEEMFPVLGEPITAVGVAVTVWTVPPTVTVCTVGIEAAAVVCALDSEEVEVLEPAVVLVAPEPEPAVPEGELSKDMYPKVPSPPQTSSGKPGHDSWQFETET